MVIQFIKIFLYSSSTYSFHLLLTSSAPTRSLLFLFFIVPIFGQNVPLITPVFLKRFLVFPFLLFYFSLYTVPWRRSLHAVLWKSAFSWLYLSLSPLIFTSLLSSAIYKASSDSHFAFLNFFFFGMVLVTASCTMLQTSVCSSSNTLSTRSNPLNLFVISSLKS